MTKPELTKEECRKIRERASGPQHRIAEVRLVEGPTPTAQPVWRLVLYREDDLPGDIIDMESMGAALAELATEAEVALEAHNLRRVEAAKQTVKPEDLP